MIVEARRKPFDLDYSDQAPSQVVVPTTRQGPFRGDHFLFEDVRVFDADGNCYEHYERLAVQADVERNSDGSVLEHNPYAAAVHCEQKGLFLPSSALSCVILARFFELREIPTFEKVLGQYLDAGSGWGTHVQNSLIDYGSNKVIHYPSTTDFREDGIVNSQGKKVSVDFDSSLLGGNLFSYSANDGEGYIDLEAALKNEGYRRLVQQLTGLRDPSILVRLSDSLGRVARLGVLHNRSSSCMVMLGGWLRDFSLSNSEFETYSPFRGVRVG
jgi:hypothetical protein